MEVPNVQPPPLPRRQTHAVCEQCGEVRERYGVGYVCWNCGHEQLSHSYSRAEYEASLIPVGAAAAGAAAADNDSDADSDSDTDSYPDTDSDADHDMVGGADLATVLVLMTVKELMTLAREYNIPGRSRMNKQGLVNSLLQLF